MKKLLLGLTLILSVNAFADCKRAYNKASDSRDTRNAIIVFSLTAATVGAGAIVSTGALGFYGGSTLFISGPTFANQIEGDGVYNNNIDKAHEALKSAVNSQPSKQLDKVIKNGIKRANLQYTSDLRARAIDLLADGYENEVFCPVVKIKSNGEEKRAVYNKRALSIYLSNNL